jgi:hypothetical protein
MPIIPPGRLRQEDPKFQVSLDYKARSYHKIKRKKERKERRKEKKRQRETGRHQL